MIGYKNYNILIENVLSYNILKAKDYTMKTIKLALSISVITLALASIQGCTPKTAGMDSGYLNKNRGAAGAQISKAEAEQYSRQQGLSADEIRLENMKRRQTTDSIREASDAASSASSATRSAVGAIDSVRGLLNSF